MPGPRGLILIADSDTKLLSHVSDLAKREGYDSILCPVGKDVLVLAVAHRPQLIMLDVQLPDMDGRDLLQAIKRDPRIAEIPVLMWSGRDYDSDRRIALELGAADYVPKSDTLMLMPKIARVLLNAKRESECAPTSRASLRG
ncbi:MAG TPA: response regulator [Polyangiaceae bacterium]|nr:response regulator [Polyangiaceae bacterium]